MAISSVGSVLLSAVLCCCVCSELALAEAQATPLISRDERVGMWQQYNALVRDLPNVYDAMINARGLNISVGGGKVRTNPYL